MLNTRDQQRYTISQRISKLIERSYSQQGPHQRERIFILSMMESRIRSRPFTEFMEQRAPDTPVWMGKFIKRMLDFKREINEEIAKLDYFNDPRPPIRKSS